VAKVIYSIIKDHGFMSVDGNLLRNCEFEGVNIIIGTKDLLIYYLEMDIVWVTIWNVRGVENLTPFDIYLENLLGFGEYLNREGGTSMTYTGTG
jgi:hypothetical protein